MNRDSGSTYDRVSFLGYVPPKGIGPGPTLAWPGWKQPAISVKVDTGRLEAGQLKKCCMDCVLLYYPSTEFQSTFNVYWHGEGAAGLSCTELSIWELPSLRGGSWKWGSIVFDIVWRRCPRRTPWMMLRTPVCSYPIIVTHLSFNFLCLLLLYSIYLNGPSL